MIGSAQGRGAKGSGAAGSPGGAVRFRGPGFAAASWAVYRKEIRVFFLSPVAYVFLAGYYVLNTGTSLERRTEFMTVTTVAALVLNVVLNLMLIPSYGILGLFAITWLLGTVVVVSEWLRRGGQGSPWGPAGSCLSISFIVALVFGLILAGRLAGVVRRAHLLQVTQVIWEPGVTSK